MHKYMSNLPFQAVGETDLGFHTAGVKADWIDGR